MATNTARLRPPPLDMPTRDTSPSSAESDDSDSSPDQERDEEAAYFTSHANESQSTICPVTGIKDDITDVDTDRLHRLTPISKLPPELLIAIFSKLTTMTDLRNCMLVSYHWALYSVSMLWHRPLCNKWPNLQNVARTLSDGHQTFPYHEMVKRLNLSAVADKVNDGTAQPFVFCKNVERLTLTSCVKLTDFGVTGLVDGNKRLQALDVTGLKALTDRTMLAVAQNCSKLQGLNITDCANVTDESLVAVAENCRQLKRLKLNGVFQATDLSITAVARNCRSILEIDLAGCESITSESVTALLASLPHLRELRLAQCTDITDLAFTNLPPKMHFDALRILDLTQCEQVRDDAIARIIPAAPRLRNLVLAKCRHITDRAVDAICKLTKNLHYIHLGHCTNLTDAAVINLVKHCNRIRYIDLACCSRLTDASVRHLAQLPKLRRIGLVKCQNLTDNSILALAHGPVIFSSSSRVPIPSQFVSLERVHLSYCVNLTLKGITALLHNCPRLTHLSLTGVQAFLREDLTRFCREAPSEFTHPQRDVFCVFSGEGVKRLRDHLTRLALDQNAMEENLLDPDDSPSADTMSDEGTIDGNEHGGDGIYGSARYGFPTISGSRRPARPRSMQNLHSASVEASRFESGMLPRNGVWTPGAPLSPGYGFNLASSHLNLTNANHHTVPPGHGGSHSSSAGPLPASASFNFDLAFEEGARSRSQTRRHTLESTAAFYTPPSPGASAFVSGLGRSLGLVEGHRMVGPPHAAMPPTPRPDYDPRSQASASSTAPYQQPFLRPQSEYSAFEANHEAIMATIPDPLQSGSPQMSRATARSRMGTVLGAMRALSSSPLGHIEFSSRNSRGGRSRETSQLQSDAHREAVLRAMMGSTRPDRDMEMPIMSTEPLIQATESPASSRGSSQHGAPLEQPDETGSEGQRDVDMT